MWGKSPIPPRHWSDNWGAGFIGDKGTLTVTTFEYVFESNDGSAREGFHHLSTTGDLDNVVFDNWEAEFDALSGPHNTNLVECLISRARSNADAEEGHVSSACCILGNLSLELGQTLRYDPKSRTILGDAEATAMLARPYRGDWKHPDPEMV